VVWFHHRGRQGNNPVLYRSGTWLRPTDIRDRVYRESRRTRTRTCIVRTDEKAKPVQEKESVLVRQGSERGAFPEGRGASCAGENERVASGSRSFPCTGSGAFKGIQRLALHWGSHESPPQANDGFGGILVLFISDFAAR